METEFRQYLRSLGVDDKQFSSAELSAAWSQSSFELALKDRPTAGILNLATGAVHSYAAKIVHQMLDAVGPDASGSFFKIQRLLGLFRQFYARTLTDTKLAAQLAGARRVVMQMPDSGDSPGTRAKGEGSALPVSLLPDPLETIINQARTLRGTMRELYLQALSPDQAKYVAERLAAPPGFGEYIPPGEPPWDPPTWELEEPPIRFPLIEEAVADLQKRRLVSRDEFDAMYVEARDEAFTVAGIEDNVAMGKVLNALSTATSEGGDLRGFKKAVAESVGQGTFLSEGHAETVFRTNIQTAYSRGMDKILGHPLVTDAFPYEEVLPIRDDRLTDLCKTIAESGIQGTAIYRRDDPVYQKFKSPRHYNDRCGRRPVTIRDAAKAGIKEAIKWLETGEPPVSPAWVKHPDVELPPGWSR